MADREKQQGQQAAPVQTQGTDEEAGEGLEQRPAPADGGPARQAPPPDSCKKDKGGIVH